MKRPAWIGMILFIFLISLSGTACEQKKETSPPRPEVEKPKLPGGELPSADLPPSSNLPLHPPSAPAVPKTPKTLAIPDTVKGQWESIILRIEDKTKQSTVDQTIALQSDYQIPESNVTIKVGDFLPQFSMDQNNITSISNETKNPALKVTVLKEGEEVFNGWLFERFPDMHPFQDDRYAIALVGYNAKASSETVKETAE